MVIIISWVYLQKVVGETEVPAIFADGAKKDEFSKCTVIVTKQGSEFMIFVLDV